jgi:hypothetical protein
MLDLIEKVREFRSNGTAVGILAYDNPEGPSITNGRRETDMAGRIRSAFITKQDARLLVLTGNVHAMLQRPERAPSEMQVPMGSYLSDLDPFSVDVVARSGESWACFARCQALELPEVIGATGPSTDSTYNFLVVLPKFSIARLIGGEASRDWN